MKENKEREQKPPIKEGEVITCRLDGIGEKNPYIKVKGFIVFIMNLNAMSDELYDIEIKTIKRNYGFGHAKRKEFL